MDLTTSFNGITLKNPLMPASGPIVGDDEKMLFLESLGLGGMVTKTISTKGAEVPRPCIYGERNYIMNAELWSEHPPEMWLEEILPNMKKHSELPLIISAGYVIEDMEYLIPKLDKYADAFEISTHYVGKDLTTIENIVKTIRKHTEKPLFMKISPHIPDVEGFVKTVKNAGANGIVAINSLGPTIKIDLKKKSVLMGNDEGFMWTSGPAIKNLALAVVYKIKKIDPEMTVIGVGGISNAKDVLEFLMAGADAVQMLSAAMINGKMLYKKIIDDLPKELEKYGFKSIEEVKNTSLIQEKIRYSPLNPIINESICTKCKLCEKICPYFAIKVEDTVEVNKLKCFGCGLCQSKCPVEAISGVY